MVRHAIPVIMGLLHSAKWHSGWSIGVTIENAFFPYVYVSWGD